MKILFFLLFSIGLNAQFSALLDNDPVFPFTVKEHGIVIMTVAQADTVVSLLENRIQLKRKIIELESHMFKSDIAYDNLFKLNDVNTQITRALVDVNTIKEKETLLLLKDVDKNVVKVSNFLFTEKNELIIKNKRLKRTLWVILPVATGLIILSNI